MPTAAVLAITAVAGAVSSKRASDKASKATKAAASTAAGQTEASATQARLDVNRLFPQAQQTARQGFQGALDVFGQSLPAQTDVFQQGNLGAQQAILSGLPQIQNALFGNQVDLGQLQPFQVQQPDLSFFNQTLPQFTPQDTMGPSSAFPSNAQGPVRGSGGSGGSLLGGSGSSFNAGAGLLPASVVRSIF